MIKVCFIHELGSLFSQFSLPFAVYGIDFMLGYMRHIMIRILQCLSIANQKSWPLKTTVSKFQKLILELKDVLVLYTSLGALHLTGYLETIKFTD